MQPIQADCSPWCRVKQSSPTYYVGTYYFPRGNAMHLDRLSDPLWVLPSQPVPRYALVSLSNTLVVGQMYREAQPLPLNRFSTFQNKCCSSHIAENMLYCCNYLNLQLFLSRGNDWWVFGESWLVSYSSAYQNSGGPPKDTENSHSFFWLARLGEHLPRQNQLDPQHSPNLIGTSPSL